MEDLIVELAEQGGLQPESVRAALGILMAFLLDTVQEGTREKLRRAHPDLHGLADPHRRKPGLFASMLGGNAALLALPGRLARVGVGTGHLRTLGPRVGDYLRQRTDAALWEEVEGQLPGLLTR